MPTIPWFIKSFIFYYNSLEGEAILRYNSPVNQWFRDKNIMNHNRHITLENSNIIVKYTNERIIPASGLAVVGALLGKSNFTKKLNHMDVTKNRSQHQIKNGDISWCAS